MTPDIHQHCEVLSLALLEKNACMATAESCTGGMIAAELGARALELADADAEHSRFELSA
ncbi:MAG: hypothetical protein RLZZ239_2269, partial [Pseudomonadota bacterium]